MGKSKKLGKLGGKVHRPGPLGEQIEHDEVAIPSGRIKIRTVRKDRDDEYVEGKLGKHIIKESLAQLREIREDELGEEGAPATSKTEPSVKLGVIGEESSDEEENVDEKQFAVPANVEKLCNDFEKEIQIDASDKTYEEFMNKEAGKQRTLADLFKDKITEKLTEINSQIDETSTRAEEISPETEQMCKAVGAVLQRYRSGALPKMFKLIPKMRNWEELVYLTEPDLWSAASVYQATRIFVSNLRDTMAQKFLNLVLLPRVRDDISYYHRLNYHLYQALCKALFKPSAFFKGILLPLCQSGSCTLREAIIIGSVIAKNSIPLIHSAAALLQIAEMNYSGASSIFIRILLDKKYALPYRVIDACVYHFLKFRNDRRELPVLWHQAFLVFVQRYKEDLSHEQKSELLDIVRFHSHPRITNEIRRELQESRCRNDKNDMEMDE